MNSGELLDFFRREVVVDTATPYLWSDEGIYLYMDAAYKMFVRLIGGIADFTTEEVTQIPLVVGTDLYDLHPSILRITLAQRLSDHAEVVVINNQDTRKLFRSAYDYGQFRTLLMTNTPGAVRFMVMGQQRDKVKTIQIPAVADTIMLDTYRLPLVRIVDGAHPLDEVAEDHHIYLADWMAHLAYKKQDAETFDKGKSDEFEASFRRYCAQCKDEWERYKHKPRAVSYGGI